MVTNELCIVICLVAFILGGCVGGMLGLKEVAKSENEWFLLSKKINDDWANYCETLIKKIKTLESGDTE